MRNPSGPDRTQRAAEAAGATAAPPLETPTDGSDAAGESAALRVSLPAFQGPLDLLLHLIQRDEIDIHDIPIAHITRQYLETLELMQYLDLEVAGEFLVMAATLMRLKARTLLPPAPSEEEEADPRASLVRQLLEYRRFKEAAQDLGRLEADRRLLWERGAPARLEDPDAGELVPVSLFRLLDALKKALERSRPASVHTIEAETISLEEAVAVLKERLRERSRLLFEEVLEQFETRLEKITAFLGLLELLKQGSIQVVQEEIFGPIWIAWREEPAAAPYAGET
jgi:segregation and condensation protein A